MNLLPSDSGRERCSCKSLRSLETDVVQIQFCVSVKTYTSEVFTRVFFLAIQIDGPPV